MVIRVLLGVSTNADPPLYFDETKIMSIANPSLEDVWQLFKEVAEAQKIGEQRFRETERLLKEQTQETERLLKIGLTH